MATRIRIDVAVLSILFGLKTTLPYLLYSMNMVVSHLWDYFCSNYAVRLVQNLLLQSFYMSNVLVHFLPPLLIGTQLGHSTVYSRMSTAQRWILCCVLPDSRYLPSQITMHIASWMSCPPRKPVLGISSVWITYFHTVYKAFHIVLLEYKNLL